MTGVSESIILSATGITKAFPGVKALDDVDLRVRAGEVVALLGENGAGKSTLIKILGGAQQLDSGTIEIDGQAVRISGPTHAMQLGIGVIYQEFNLIPELTVAENLFLGREPSLGFVRRGHERETAARLLNRLDPGISPSTPCRRLSVAQQQIVEIAKSLSQDVKVLVMDEPTAALSQTEVQRLFELVSDLTQRGISVVYVSHRLEEIFAIADRVVVLRDGKRVGERSIDAVSRAELIQLMVGREISDEFPDRQTDVGPVKLEVRRLSRGREVHDVDFEVHAGEILGITGLVGSGRTELVRLLFGADRRDSGEIRLDGKSLAINHPRDAIRAGLCLLTEDRKQQGLVLELGVRENFGLPNLGHFSRAGFVSRAAERSRLQHYVDALRIRLSHLDQPTKNLSGGNQQKVVLAKWLQQNSSVIIFDEPTRGIDVGAKYEIYLLLKRLAAEGKAIIMISSELPEVIGMSDRVLVMHDGRITGEVRSPTPADQPRLMELAVQ